MLSKPEKFTIALDAMGGDYAPSVTVEGAISALKESRERFDVFLVGEKDKINSILSKNNWSFPEEKIVHAPETIEMTDIPTAVIKSKPNSSMSICIDLIKQGKAHAFVSAGNTGAVMTISTLKLGRIQGISRPAIATLVPTLSGKSLFLDVGANVDCKPFHLYEFALMGMVYMKEIFGIENPRIGLLSIGEEDTKGNEVTVAANKILKESRLNFVGNVEGRDILKGNVEVIVGDGFIGNIVLKFAEGFLQFFIQKLRDKSNNNLIDKLKLGLAKPILMDILKVFDYQEYGGIPLLGVNNIVIIGHGSSSALAIKNMIFRAYESYEHQIVERTRSAIEEFRLYNN